MHLTDGTYSTASTYTFWWQKGRVTMEYPRPEQRTPLIWANWMRELADPAEDVYTLDDGEPPPEDGCE